MKKFLWARGIHYIVDRASETRMRSAKRNAVNQQRGDFRCMTSPCGTRDESTRRAAWGLQTRSGKNPSRPYSRYWCGSPPARRAEPSPAQPTTPPITTLTNFSHPHIQLQQTNVSPPSTVEIPVIFSSLSQQKCHTTSQRRASSGKGPRSTGSVSL